MRFAESQKKNIKVTLSFFLLLCVLAVFSASCGKNRNAEPEVISKRIKLDLPDASGVQQPKSETKPIVENMPDVKSDLPVKDVVKSDTTAPAMKMELPDKKYADTSKGNRKEPDPGANGKDSVGRHSRSLAVAENGESEQAAKKVYSKSVLKKLKLKPWAVNVASFPSEAEAKKLISNLKSAGYRGYVTEFTKNGVKWHRVRVGFYHTRDEAIKTGKRIETKFHVRYAWAVQPAREEALEHIR